MLSAGCSVRFTSTGKLLGVVAILVAIASAVWYGVSAPSRGTAVAPGPAAEVALTATQTGSGSWVRYLLTVHNASDSAFSGQVVLIDHDVPADSGASALQLPSTSKPANLPSAGSEVAPESAYEVHLTVAARKDRTITVVAPDSFNYAQVRDDAGNPLADAEVDRVPVVPVAVLSDLEAAATAIGGVHFDRYSTHVAQYQQARGFPATPLLLGSYAAVVVDQFDTAALSRAQLQALRDYVGLGGALVLAGGVNWRRTLAPLPGELLPLRPSATTTASLAPLSALAGVKLPDAAVPAAAGALAAGAHVVLAGAEGSPLVVEAAYGAGRIIELAFDPSADGVPAGLANAAWSQAIGRAFAELPGGSPTVSALPGPESNFSLYFGPPADAPLPSPWLVGPLLLSYLVIVGPINYLFLRRRLKRPALLWLTAPLVAVSFTGGFYVIGQTLQGSLQDHSVQVLRLAPDGVAAQIQYDRILFLRRGDHVVQAAAGSIVAPMTLNTYRTSGSTCERCTVQLAGLAAGSEHVIPGASPLVDEQGVVYGSVRVVATTTAGRPPVGLATHLAVKGGRVQGTVANLGARPVRGVELFSFDGQLFHSAYLAGSIPPGGVAEVDAASMQLAAGPAPGAPGQGREGSALARILATAAMERDRMPLIVAFTDPLASSLQVDGEQPPTSTITALEQPVTLEAADGLLADFSRTLLASTSGNQRDGFLDAYDLVLPLNTTPGVQLSWDKRWAQQVEIYDWTAGAWHPAGFDPEDANPIATVGLAGGDTAGGLVRVRVREPRLSWGSTLAVEMPKPPG